MIRKNAAGEFVFDPIEDSLELTDALKEIFNSTPVGQMFVKSYYSSENEELYTEKLIRAARIVSGSENVSTNDLVRGLTLLIDSGEIPPREAEEPVQLAEPEVDTRPRDRNGKLLSPQQIARSEYRQFAESASMAEINLRKQSDAGFANFVRKNLQREVNQPVGDAITPLGTNSVAPPPADRELAEFARNYLVEPSGNLKPKAGYVTLAGEQISWTIFQTLLARATNARLI